VAGLVREGPDALASDLGAAVQLLLKIIGCIVLNAEASGTDEARLVVVSCDVGVGSRSTRASHDDSVLINLLVPCLLSALVGIFTARPTSRDAGISLIIVSRRRVESRLLLLLRLLVRLELGVRPLLLGLATLLLLILNQVPYVLDLLLVQRVRHLGSTLALHLLMAHLLLLPLLLLHYWAAQGVLAWEVLGQDGVPIVLGLS